MKIKITFKDPDGVHDTIAQAITDEVWKIPDLSESERDWICEGRLVETKDALGRWLKYDELVTIEFDIAANTARVLLADET